MSGMSLQTSELSIKSNYQIFFDFFLITKKCVLSEWKGQNWIVQSFSIRSSAWKIRLGVISKQDSSVGSELAWYAGGRHFESRPGREFIQKISINNLEFKLRIS